MSAAERMPPCRQWMLMVGLCFLFVYSMKSVSFWVQMVIAAMKLKDAYSLEGKL